MSAALHGELVDMDEQVGKVQRALVDFDAGARTNVAILGEPLAGKTSLLDAVIARYGKQVQKVSLAEVICDADHLPSLAGPEKIIAVDNCQYLFLRRIGGFGALERFLDVLASSDRLFLTVWNTFAWNYLKQIFTVQDYFPVIVPMPALGEGEIAAVIGARYELDKVRFVDHRDDDRVLATIKRGAEAPGSLLAGGENGLRRLAFEKIAGLAHGNPGVALALWQKAYHDGEVTVSDIAVPDYEADLSPDEAFVVSNILMMRSITSDDLQKVTFGYLRLDRILYTLLSRGLIRKAADRYSVEPLALHAVTKSLKGSRQVW